MLLVRFVDRPGKGLGPAPAQALLADASRKEQVGRTFGFHKMMDVGGVMGRLWRRQASSVHRRVSVSSSLTYPSGFGPGRPGSAFSGAALSRPLRKEASGPRPTLAPKPTWYWAALAARSECSWQSSSFSLLETLQCLVNPTCRKRRCLDSRDYRATGGLQRCSQRLGLA